MILDEWLSKIRQLHPVKWDLGLDRVGEVGRRLDLIRPAGTVFLIAGTNGKGSTCEFLAQLCRELGLSYGKTTSPFLLRYNEQIVVDGAQVSDQEICEAFARIEGVRADISLTYFEFGALAALDIFKRRHLDVAIVEIGLGGRLDAMNIIDPDVSIITQIDIDHCEWLGENREAIGREKAGILRAGKPCVCVDPEPPESIFEVARSLGVSVRSIDCGFSLSDEKLDVGNRQYELRNLQLPVPSAGAAIIAMMEAGFNLDQGHVDRAARNASLPGRFQVLQQYKRKTILDVAHNPNAARYLVQKLIKEGFSNVQAVAGMYADKDIEQVFQILTPVVSKWHLCDLEDDRAASSADLMQCLLSSCGLSGQTYDKVSLAYEAAVRQAEETEIVLVFGSFPVVASVLIYLETDRDLTGRT
jgi:dihydrofolate synthase/folylpolyglutamate synthase